MKHVVLVITTAMYLAALVAAGSGLFLGGRSVYRHATYEAATATPLDVEGAEYRTYGSDWYCWSKYRYRVAGKQFFGPAGCLSDRSEPPVPILYKSDDPGISVVDDRGGALWEGLLLIVAGAALAWWAATWRSRSYALHGLSPPGVRWGSAAAILVPILVVCIPMALMIVSMRNEFCGTRRAILAGAIEQFVRDYDRRLPRDWARAFGTRFDTRAVLTASEDCLGATHFMDLPRLCANGFHIRTAADYGSAVCEWSGRNPNQLDLEYVTDTRTQTVSVRLIPQL